MGRHRARFEALYAAHAPAVRAYALRRIDPATADDVLSEVFLVAWRRLDELPDQPRLWLLGVARKTIANQRRTEARWQALHQQLGHERSPASSAGSSPDDREPVDRGVLQALAALRPTDREALLLVGWDDLKPREAAEVVGIAPTTFTMRLSRARRRFAQLLEAERAQGATASPQPQSRVEVPDAS